MISLPERSEIHALEFDTGSSESDARAAKDIDVAISDTSATGGFTSVAAVSLKPGANKQRVALAKPASGPRVKLTIKTNHGDAVRFGRSPTCSINSARCRASGRRCS